MEAIADLIKDIEPGDTSAFIPPPPEPKKQIYKRTLLAELDTNHHPQVCAAVNAARDWMIRRRTIRYASLVLIAISRKSNDDNCTGYGCGKTHIARACLDSECLCVDDDPIAPTGKFFMADDIIQEIQPGIGMRSILGTRTAIQDKKPILVDPPILVIDDVGTEKTIPYTSADMQDAERQNRYFQIINYCYMGGIALVITGNLDLKRLAHVIGGRAWSRLQCMAPKGFIVNLTGVPDWRRGRR